MRVELIQVDDGKVLCENINKWQMCVFPRALWRHFLLAKALKGLKEDFAHAHQFNRRTNIKISCCQLPVDGK